MLRENTAIETDELMMDSECVGNGENNGNANEKNTTVRPPLEIYLREVNEIPPLTAAQEQELGERIQAGDRDAHDHMVRANLRLVVRIARDYIGRGLPLQDLIAEGNLGVMRAADKFDPTMNTRFNTYATYWIRHEIRNFIYRSKPIRLPDYVIEMLSKWRKIAADLGVEPYREANFEKIAKEMGFDEKKTKIIRRAFQSSRPQTGQEVEEILAGNSEQPEVIVMAGETRERIRECIDMLKEKERDILRMQFGMHPFEKEYTIEDIMEKLDLKRVKLYKIRNSALKKLEKELTKMGIQ